MWTTPECRAYGCRNRAKCHGVLCSEHWPLTSPKSRKLAAAALTFHKEECTAETTRAYHAATERLVAEVNRVVTPPSGARPAPTTAKGAAGGFTASAFSAAPMRNRIEEI